MGLELVVSAKISTVSWLKNPIVTVFSVHNEDHTSQLRPQAELYYRLKCYSESVERELLSQDRVWEIHVGGGLSMEKSSATVWQIDVTTICQVDIYELSYKYTQYTLLLGFSFVCHMKIVFCVLLHYQALVFKSGGLDSIGNPVSTASTQDKICRPWRLDLLSVIWMDCTENQQKDLRKKNNSE